MPRPFFEIGVKAARSGPKNVGRLTQREQKC